MSPIRVGFIGLGRAAKPQSPGAWGSLAHLPSLVASPHYEIRALCNTTVKSAKSSIDFHKLPSGVKAYGSPQELADDPELDLIICSVVVTKHYDLIKPALLAGKDVFVEWPLAATTAQSEELVAIAQEKNLKTFLGCQARADPLVVKVKELVASGRIGNVLSSIATGSFVGLPSPWPVDAKYYVDIDSGGNVLTIHYGHFLDSFIHVLGDFASLTSLLKIEESSTALVDTEGVIVEKNYPKNTPDEIFVQGTLHSGAIVSTNFRHIPTGKSVTGTGIRWIITGTKGEIEITTREISWQMGFPGTSLKIRIGSGEAEEVDFKDANEPPYVSGVGLPGINTARAYEAFANGESDKYPNFEQGLATHKLLDAIRTGHL